MAEEIKKEEVKQEVATVEHINMVADLQGGLYSSSDTLRVARNYAQDLSKSTMIPMQYQNNYANCMVAMEYANRTGQSVLQVMQSLDVIQGTPAWRGKALIAMVNSSGKYDHDLKFTYGKDEKTGEINSCFAYTHKDGDLIEGIPYTIAKAEKEGLLKKNNSYWQKDPTLMLTYRAVSRFVSINCPEISLGLYTSEEQRDIEFLRSQEKKKASLNDILADDDVVVVGEVVE